MADPGTDLIVPIRLDVHGAAAESFHPGAPFRGERVIGKLSKKPNGFGEKLGIRVCGAAYFFACHGVAGKKTGLMGAPVKWPRTFGNGNFDAAYVGHQLMRFREWCELFHPVLNGEDGAAQENQIATDCGIDWIERNDIDSAALERDSGLGCAPIPADDLTGKLGSAQRQARGGADKSCTHDGDALDGHRTSTPIRSRELQTVRSGPQQ